MSAHGKDVTPLSVKAVLMAAGVTEVVADGIVQQLDDEEHKRFNWRLVRPADSTGAVLELGAIYTDVPDRLLTALMHSIGENLIKAGTKMLQSSIGDDEDDDEGGDAFDGGEWDEDER